MKRITRLKHLVGGHLTAKRKLFELQKEHRGDNDLIWAKFLDWLYSDVVHLTQEQEVAAKWLLAGGYKHLSKKPGYIVCYYTIDDHDQVRENTFSSFHPVCGCLTTLCLEEDEKLILQDLI